MKYYLIYCNSFRTSPIRRKTDFITVSNFITALLNMEFDAYFEEDKDQTD